MQEYVPPYDAPLAAQPLRAIAPKKSHAQSRPRFVKADDDDPNSSSIQRATSCCLALSSCRDTSTHCSLSSLFSLHGVGPRRGYLSRDFQGSVGSCRSSTDHFSHPRASSLTYSIYRIIASRSYPPLSSHGYRARHGAYQVRESRPRRRSAQLTHDCAEPTRNWPSTSRKPPMPKRSPRSASTYEHVSSTHGITGPRPPSGPASRCMSHVPPPS